MRKEEFWLSEYTKRNRFRRIWKKLVKSMACVVVFCTVYALILPAITQEREAFCGAEAHVHEEACYSQTEAPQTAQLVCSTQTLGVHSHGEGCYDADGNPICGQADYVVHAHDDSCRDPEGNLICTLPEIQQHIHTDSCYAIAETEPATEPAEVHVHGEECYSTQPGQLICEKDQVEAHTHGDGCYGEQVLICTTPENHVHGTACYETGLTCQLPEDETHTHEDTCRSETLICVEEELHVHGGDCQEQPLTCTLPETEGHAHEDSCYEEVRILSCGLEEGAEAAEASAPTQQTDPAEPVLICTEPEAQVHVHSESCFETTVQEQPLTCALTEDDTHTHTDRCYGTWEQVCPLEEHTHSLACYSDPNGDVETAEDWEATFADVALTGHWRTDTIAIAASQLGYTESTRNYTVLEDGETIHGYTRYGAWYGDPYGDWCAMFAAFCLDYAGTEGMPYHSNCQSWIEALTARSLYQATGSYVPQSGDLIFFDHDANGFADHVGLVEAVVSGDAQTAITLNTIEGNSSNSVRQKSYSMDDATILGYGTLPVQVDAQTQAVIDMIDALPSADEIDARLAQYEEAQDYEGEEAYYTEVTQQVNEAYAAYSALSDEQKANVTNADKLMELEYIWSAAEYSSVITSAAPTRVDYSSTRDFIELNIYDYVYGINTKYDSDHKYPGFQWNGGAYSNQNDGYTNDYRYYYENADDGIANAITDRYYIDSIDFGNSIITNYQYQGSDYEKSTTAMDIGKLYNNSGASSTGKINWLWYDGSDYSSATNRPVGFSTGYQSLSRTLSNGYPALSDNSSLSYLFSEEESYVIKQNEKWIEGLFQQDPVSGEYSYNSRLNHAQYDTADYDNDGDTDEFILFDQIITPNFITYPFGNFLPFNTITDNAQATQVGAFNYDGGMKAYVEGIIADLQADLNRDDDGNGTDADYGDTSRSQLITMLQEYRENWNWFPTNNYSSNLYWNNLSPANAIRDYFNGTSNGGNTPSSDLAFLTQDHLNRMYNIDWDVATNFFFGMEMKMTFMQPKDGYTGNDTNGDGASDYPMVFYFTGDDDVWVYIDGVLFLDLTGIHRHVGGEIDFVNGWVYYYELDVENGGDVSSTPYAQYSFAALMREAGWTEEQIDAVLEPLDSNGNRPFKDYTTHSFNFYYIERGSGSSVCRMNFNFPLLKQNSISVTKENITVDGDGNASNTEVLGNPDYYFNIVTSQNELFVGPGSVTGVSTYKITDSSGNILKNEDGSDQIFTVDQYGIFTLKAGQTAVFEGIQENEGKFFVQELIKAEDNGQYHTVYINDTETRYNKLIDWQYRKYFSNVEVTDVNNPIYIGPYGCRWYGRSGYDTDSSSNASFYFEQQNHLDVSKLGALSITKILEGEDTDRTFDMEVTLDGEKLPVGTRYTVGSETRTVATEGIITLAPGETATIPGIISGAKFTVRETNGTGYTVDYAATQWTDANEIEIKDGKITGVVRTGTTVGITVTNSEHGASVEIPVTKTLTNADDGGHSYLFTLVQVQDQDGTPLDPAGTSQELTLNVPDSPNGVFPLSYLKHTFSSGTTKLYYKITESPADGTAENTQVFIAEVTVTSSDTDFSAELTNMWANTGENGAFEEHGAKSADFVNTLVGELSLKKIVLGNTESMAQTFDFTITLDPAAPGEVRYPAAMYDADGSVTQESSIQFTDGTASITGVSNGMYVVISGLPVGTKWTITETTTDGFTVGTEVTAGGAVTEGTEATVSGTIVSGETSVVYTNTKTYILPETGGTGTPSYTMAGFVLMLSSAAYLLYRHRKRRREVS